MKPSQEKKFEFVSEAAKKAFLELPKDIIKQFGADLNEIQKNKPPFSDFKDISDSVGAGAIELIENGSPAYRAVYCAKYQNTVYILHAFTKTTNGVDKPAMRTAKMRYTKMMEKIEEGKRAEKKK